MLPLSIPQNVTLYLLCQDGQRPAILAVLSYHHVTQGFLLRDQPSLEILGNSKMRQKPMAAPICCKGAEPVIHGDDLRYCLTVVVRHDRRLWRCDCSI